MHTKEGTMEEENNSRNLGMEGALAEGRQEWQTIRKMMREKRSYSDDSDTDEGLGLRKSSTRTKACKTRRARRKAFRPYYQLSEEERDVREEREKQRVAKLRERMQAKGRIIAPYNTTQFLMSDQAEDDFYFSKPTNDQEFMNKEFKKDYDDQYMNRLEKMTKEMLLNEYMIIERKNENLEEKLQRSRKKDEEKSKLETELLSASDTIENDAVQKISTFQREMERLRQENQRLLAENLKMKEMLKNHSSDDSSSSSSSSSSSDSESEDEKKPETQEAMEGERGTSEDNGYESNQSSGEIML